MTDSDERPRLEINWAQSAGGALAAVSSAVLLSTFGVAGTLIGAAIGSLVITVGGAIYSYSIRTTRQRVATAQTLAAARIGLAQARVRRASEEVAKRPRRAADAAENLAEAEGDLDRAQAVLEDEAEDSVRLTWRQLLRGLPWKRIAVIATALFVAAMLVILVFELITGRAVSSYTGGSDPDRRTSIPGFSGEGDSTPAPTEQTQTPTEDVSPSEGASDQVEPTVDPTATPTDDLTDPVPSESLTAEPTVVPTTGASPTP